MSHQNRKAARRAAIELEKRKREDALAVPADKQVYVLRPHFPDEGGPRGFWTAEYRDHPDDFDFEEWDKAVEAAPSGWTPVEIVPEEDPEFLKVSAGDFAEFQSLMIFSRRAAQSLHHVLQPSGAFLPLQSDQGEYVGFRLDKELDVLDMSKTRACWRAKKQGQPDSASSIYSYAFRTDKLSHAVFRVPQHYDVLVLQPFVEIVRAEGLTGFRYCRVWPTAMCSDEKWC